MKLGLFLTIAAIIALVFGLSFILVPFQTMAMYGVTMDIAGQWVGRYLGSAFIGIAALNWFARNAAKNGAMRAIILGDFVISITGLIVSVLDGIFGPGNALIWSTVVIYLYLALASGYYQFVKPVAS